MSSHIYAFDVYYGEGRAKAVGIAFAEWGQALPDATWCQYLEGVAQYEPGAFYRRELPCLLSLLQDAPFAAPKCIVVDGYVCLSEGRAGLGQHLFEALHGKVPVIGIAKTYFFGNSAQPIFRGGSKNPLYVSSAGMPIQEAVVCIEAMHGHYRMPTLLKHLDTITRKP